MLCLFQKIKLMNICIGKRLTLQAWATQTLYIPNKTCLYRTGPWLAGSWEITSEPLESLT